MYNKIATKNEQLDIKIAKSKLRVKARENNGSYKKERKSFAVNKQIKESKLLDSEIKIAEGEVIETTSFAFNQQQKYINLID